MRSRIVLSLPAIIVVDLALFLVLTFWVSAQEVVQVGQVGSIEYVEWALR